MPVSESIQQAAWRRIKKNKTAVFGIIIITMAILVAVFAYFIAPDDSPFANRMTVEIGGKNPGYTRQFLLVKKETAITSNNLFSRLFYGREDAYTYLPVNNYLQAADSMIVQKYIDDGIEERIAFPLRAVGHTVISKKFLLGTV
ncbi:MAG: hypothetical protein NVSMB7_10310 [Chitinophagaceae bacterium]